MGEGLRRPMKVILIATLLLTSTVVLISGTPSAVACTPPNCPGFGGCHLNKPSIYTDTSGQVPQVYVAVDPRLIECYY